MYDMFSCTVYSSRNIIITNITIRMRSEENHLVCTCIPRAKHISHLQFATVSSQNLSFVTIRSHGYLTQIIYLPMYIKNKIVLSWTYWKKHKSTYDCNVLLYT
jgi:hypothetical protein